MEQKTIIERNLGIYRWCKNNPDLTTKDEAQYAIKQVQDYESWGRCRKLIDPNSEEYKTAYEFLESYGHKRYEIKDIISMAQSASLTAFYTPTDIAKTITDFALTSYEKLNGKPAQTLLDPSCGTGAFLTGLEGNEHLKYVECCEKDEMTRVILDKRLQAMNKVAHYHNKTVEFNGNGSYENINKDWCLDIIVSNMPFGNIKVYDKAFAKLGFIAADSCKAIHNYYFMKSLHLLNKGGIMAFITTRGFLSSNSNKEFREEMLRHGKVISIIRLPDNLFKTVDVGSDLIVYQKGNPIEGDMCALPNRLQRLFCQGVPETEPYALNIPNTTVVKVKNQYGKEVWRYKYHGADMAADLKEQLDAMFELFMKRIDEQSKEISHTNHTQFSTDSDAHFTDACKMLHYGNHFFMFFE